MKDIRTALILKGIKASLPKDLSIDTISQD